MALVAGLGVLASQLEPSLTTVAIACTGCQLALAYALIRSSEHTISLTSGFVLIWLMTYLFRLLQITLAPDLRYHHPAILLAGNNSTAWVWVLTTLGFGAFVLGALVTRRVVPAARAVKLDVRIERQVVLALSFAFLVLSYALAILDVRSGFLGNISQFYLFLIAYASYRSAEAGRSVGPEVIVVLLASILGVTLGFKEFAVLPVVAWFIGQLGGRRRILSAGAVSVVVIGAFFYVGIQGQRAAEVLGEDSSFVPAFQRGITDYDLVTGTFLEKSGPDIVYNVLAAMGSRLTGVDALFVLDAKVPEVVPHQQGRTLWQPLISVVPGTEALTSPELSNLSLGRYTTQTFWSLRPDQDQSSQPLTVVGDFWLSFGPVGVMVGLLAFGALYQFVDRRAGVSSAAAAGLFAYAAIPMLAIERNVSYLLFTGMLRYAFGLFMIRRFREAAGASSGEQVDREPPDTDTPSLRLIRQ